MYQSRGQFLQFLHEIFCWEKILMYIFNSTFILPKLKCLLEQYNKKVTLKASKLLAILPEIWSFSLIVNGEERKVRKFGNYIKVGHLKIYNIIHFKYNILKYTFLFTI